VASRDAMTRPVGVAATNRIAVAVRYLDLGVDILVGAALLGELLVVIASVVGRTVFDWPILWADEAGNLALSVIAFLGGAIAYRREQHVFVRTFVDMLPPRWHDVCYGAVDWLVCEIAVVALFHSLPLLDARWDETTPVLEMRATWLVLPLTGGMAVLAIYALVRLFERTATSAITSLAGVAAATIAVCGVHNLWLLSLPSDVAVWAAMVVVVLTVLLGLPVGFALILGTVLYLYSGGLVSLVALPQNMVDGVSRFVLLALPFFIFAGFVMEQGGISRRLVMFVAALVGRLRGGLLQVMVISMYLVSGISGSKSADVAAVGLVMRGMLKEEGYDPAEGAAVLAASAAMGETVPPSIGILVLGSITALSTGALFAAGLIPAAVIALCLMLLIYLRAGRMRVRSSPRVDALQLRGLAVRAIIPFSMPAMLFAGIFTGFATPTEVSAFAVAYGLLIAILLFREARLRDLARMISDASTVAGMVLFTLAAAQSFSWVLAAAQVPQRLAMLVASGHDSPVIFMGASIVMLVVLGMLLEGLPALLILAPLLVPLAPGLGIDPLHYGIVLLIAMGIGSFLPPLGIGFYIACAVARARMERASRIMVPYAVVLLLGLLVVAYVPEFTLFLPRVFGFVP
jgi:tripartite ATP-independent transporter DctM subunit